MDWFLYGDEDEERQCERHGCKNLAEDMHSCPYKLELYDDRESKCNCCEHCSNECAWDV